MNDMAVCVRACVCVIKRQQTRGEDAVKSATMHLCTGGREGGRVEGQRLDWWSWRCGWMRERDKARKEVEREKAGSGRQGGGGD